MNQKAPFPLYFLIWVAFPRAALALSAIAGDPIVDNDYSVAIQPSVAVGSARKVALGGAFVAVAEGVESLWENPAGAAFRRPSQTGKWRVDATLGSFSVDGDDMDNNGSVSTAIRQNQVINVGGLLQYKGWGVGLYAVAQQYDLATPDGVRRLTFMVGALDLGWASRSKELFFGVGIRPVSAESVGRDTGVRTLHLTGSGGTLGLLWHPNLGAWRFGLAGSGSIKDDGRFPRTATETVVIDGMVIPREVTIPAAASFGASFTKKKGTYWAVHPLLISVQGDLTGKIENAVGVESFLEQRVQRTAERVTLTPRLGAEWESWPQRLRIRAGSYFEPSRFEGVPGRLHGTGGVQLRLFRFHFLGDHHVAFNYAVDGASRYLTHFIGLGFWAF